MTKRLSLGITFIPQFPPEQLVDFARRAESAGFDSLWLYEDCFYAGGFVSAATALAATRELQVGIGILPFAARNPVFAAMEIAALARLYPGRFIAGFGHGYEPWMKQIGALQKPSIQGLEETVTAVRGLLRGEEVSLHGSHVQLDQARLLLPPAQVPPLYVGGVREKTLRLAGRAGDGTALSVLSSPDYVRWASAHITGGQAEAGQRTNTRCVTVICNVDPDGEAARQPVRRWLAECIQGGGPHLAPIGLEQAARAHFQRYGLAEGAARMPAAWVDALSASGTPQQAAETVWQLSAAGADSVVLAPVAPDPDWLDGIIRCLLPLIKPLV